MRRKALLVGPGVCVPMRPRVPRSGQPGLTGAEGLLLYDRHSWMKGPPREGAAVVIERATLARPVTLLPTGYENWFIP